MLGRRSLLLALSLSAALFAQESEQPSGKTFRATGMVKHPGQFDLEDGMRVFDGLNRAGGFAEFANTKKITIIRDGERISFSYRDFIRGKNIEQNILLQNGDVIDVP